MTVKTNVLKKHYLFSGEVFFSLDPCMVSTVAGSCVVVCLWDPVLRAGGINHFVAPRWEGKGAPSWKYGDIAMGALMKGMLRLGSRKPDLQAKVFGGGTMISLAGGLPDFGRGNVAIAKEILDAEKVPITECSVGRDFGRKLAFNTYDGSVSLERINALPARQRR